ncbi:hypothetical protein D5H75_24155 [Bailinhaonella thermotolerans]|uniref:Peptidase S8/S53 domain-containing protein n=1 Tax=Bailinhaonella thermotolerans TaxID=1070861 RepID=A0A3A4ANJ6_9ACTN|nr:hypothetical protein D5H75_24155 [Bailinhaonella thermotolerans]
MWALSRGKGVVVAVVDSGVDTTHPQLTRQMAGTVDLSGTVDRDCLGHGTAVAGIIAAADLTAQGVPFAGVAPEARLLSVKQTNEERGDVGVLAKGIKEAVDRGAKVVNVSAQAADQPDLKYAVEYALWKDVVVVAAAGNVRRDDGAEVPAYPANYPGVISVGSATPDGSRADSSNTATRVSVIAPGMGLTSTWTGRGYAANLQGTSFAAPYVAGVAALIRARHPHLKQAQVKRRIELTSDGQVGAGTGGGMVNALQAVSAIVPGEGAEGAPVAQPVVAPPPPTPVAVQKARELDPDAALVTLLVGGGALVATLLVIGAGVVVPHGRRRSWRPGRKPDVARPYGAR